MVLGTVFIDRDKRCVFFFSKSVLISSGRRDGRNTLRSYVTWFDYSRNNTEMIHTWINVGVCVRSSEEPWFCNYTRQGKLTKFKLHARIHTRTRIQLLARGNGGEIYYPHGDAFVNSANRHGRCCWSTGNIYANVRMPANKLQERYKLFFFFFSFILSHARKRPDDGILAARTWSARASRSRYERNSVQVYLV